MKQITLLSTILTFTLFLLFSGCFDKENITLTLLDRQTLEAVPAASGIELIGNDFYAVGDNTPWLYQLNSKYELTDKFHVSPQNPVSDEILSKNDKPDFEAITLAELNNTKELWVFGSGSKSPKRDVLVRFDFATKKMIQSFSLTEFYKEIIASCNLGDGNLNIEATAAVDGNLYLFNRGINMVLQYSLSELTDYLSGKAKCPKPMMYHIKLPENEKVQVGFSGATISPDKKNIIFTASAEATKNWVDDGEILGSYVGVINFKDLKDNYQAPCLPIMKDGKILPVKIESVAVIQQKKQSIDLLLVSDSDGGPSERFNIRLN